MQVLSTRFDYTIRLTGYSMEYERGKISNGYNAGAVRRTKIVLWYLLKEFLDFKGNAYSL